MFDRGRFRSPRASPLGNAEREAAPQCSGSRIDLALTALTTFRLACSTRTSLAHTPPCTLLPPPFVSLPVEC